jgi:proteasome lid subunit RPN8/RPN11
MIVSSVEAYPEECLGGLWGYRAWSAVDKTRRAIIEQAISYQKAERTTRTVEIKPRLEWRCKDMLYKLCQLELVGDFHSHPKGTSNLSQADKDSMEIGDVELVIAISRKTRMAPWKYDDSRKELSGVFGDFRFTLTLHSCYKPKQQNRKFEKIHLLCPFAVGIGSKYFDTTIRFPE